MGFEPLARAPRAKEEPWFVGLVVRLIPKEGNKWEMMAFKAVVVP